MQAAGLWKTAIHQFAQNNNVSTDNFYMWDAQGVLPSATDTISGVISALGTSVGSPTNEPNPSQNRWPTALTTQKFIAGI